MYHIFFIHSSVDGHLGCFHVLAIVNSAAMKTGVHGSFLIMVFSRYMPRSGIAGSLLIMINRFSSSVLFPTHRWVAMQGGFRAFSNQVFSLPLPSVFHYYPFLRITMEASITCLVINGALLGTHHVSVVTLRYARGVAVISTGPFQLCDVVGEVSYCLCLQSLSKRGHKNGFTLF